MRLRLTVATLSIAILAVAACGGGSGNQGGDNTAAPASTDADPGDTSAVAEGQPVNGPVVSLRSVEIGLYAIDSATDEVRDLTIDGVDFTDRENQPVVIGDAAYVLTFTTLEGQTFSNTVGIGRVDLATGEGTQIAELGVDRATDDAPDLTTYEILGGSGDTIWVRRGMFGAAEDSVYLSFDTATGTAGTEMTIAPYTFTSANGGECTGDLSGSIITSNGRMIGLTAGWPAEVDTVTGEIEPLFDWCDFETTMDLGAMLEPSALNDYAATEDGQPIPSADAKDILGVVEPQVTNGTFVEGDGSLWWIFNTSTGYGSGDDYTSATVGGIAEFDLATNSIVETWPLGASTTTYEDRSDENTISVSTLSQADLRFLDGRLWIVDWREDAPVLVLDPSDGTMATIEIPKGQGIDFTAARLGPSDPESIWIEVNRAVVTRDDESGRQSSGTFFLDQLDPATDMVVSSIDETTIVAF